MGLFSFFRNKPSIKDVLRQGAVIVDVRSVHEYDQGRIKESLNIPVERVQANIERLKSYSLPIVFCGSSNSEVSKAIDEAQKYGIGNVYNGGNWQKLLNIIQSL